MKEFRDLLDKVYLVYYVVVDTSNELHSTKYYYADVVFKNYSTALSYIKEANDTFNSKRKYYIVDVPII